MSEQQKSEQYYTPDPTCASRPAACHFAWRGQVLRFTTDAGVFSRGELDKGTKLLLDSLPELHGRVLDLGCGWGAIGVAVGKKYPDTDVTMADVNHRALALAKDNAEQNGVALRCMESDGMAALMGEKFDTVITNPPIRAGKQVIYQMFADIASCLAPEGSLYLVIRKQQGAESCMKYLKTLYAQVEKLSRSEGFWVLKASEPLERENEQKEGNTHGL